VKRIAQRSAILACGQAAEQTFRDGKGRGADVGLPALFPRTVRQADAAQAAFLTLRLRVHLVNAARVKYPDACIASSLMPCMLASGSLTICYPAGKTIENQDGKK